MSHLNDSLPRSQADNRGRVLSDFDGESPGSLGFQKLCFGVPGTAPLRNECSSGHPRGPGTTDDKRPRLAICNTVGQANSPEIKAKAL